MIIKKNLLILAFLISSVSLFSQSVSKPTDSKDHLVKGITSLTQEMYVDAIKNYEKIGRSDTNYTLAQLNVVIAHYLNEDYKAVVPICEKMLFDFDEYEISFYRYQIKALFKLENWAAARKVITTAKKEYPLYHQFQVFDAMCLKGEGEKEMAEALLQDIIKRNTFSAAAHYELGKLAAENGRVVRAILSLHFAIVSDNGMNNLSECYTLLEDLCNNNHSPDSKITAADQKEFKDVFELIESGIASKSAYKSELGVNYSLTSTVDLLIKSVEYNKKSADFWMQFYVPIVKHVENNNWIPGYTMAFLRVNNSPLVKQLEAKYKNQTSEVIDYIIDTFYEKTSVQKFPINGVTYNLPYNYGSGNNLYAVGKLNDEDQREGQWTYFNLKGKVTSKINYKAGDIEGYSEWYDDHQQISSYYTLSDGKMVGKQLYSNDLDIPQWEAEYKDGELHGKINNYYDNGLVKNTVYFKEGKRDGPYFEYNYAGDTVTRGAYKNGELNGKYKEYFASGELSTEQTFVDGKKEGPAYSYYLNGNIYRIGKYSNGREVGKWEFYHKNGQLELFYTLTEKGKADGWFYELHDNGDTSRTGYLKKGKLNGIETTYSSQGKLYSRTTYKKGKIKFYQFFDSLGQLISEGKKEYVVFDEFGYKYYQGKFKGKKGRHGLWKYYYKNGNTSKELNYIKGKLEGAASWYYESGELESKGTYKNDELDGVYTEYFENGNLKLEGWYVDGYKEGSWKEFNIKGELIEESYYLDGEFDRFYTTYNNDGRKKAETFYNEGILTYVSFFDTTGKLLKKTEFVKGSGKYVTPAFVKGRTYIDGEFKNGKRNGLFKSYYSNNKVSAMTTYKAGTRHGKYTHYHYNGKLYETGVYEFGNQEGVWKQYYDNGKLMNVYQYKNGIVVGTVKHYYKNGKLNEVYRVDADGQKHGPDSIFYDNGVLSRVLPMHHGWINSDYVVYDTFGKEIYKKYYNGDQFYGYAYMKDGNWTPMIKVEKLTNIKSYFPNGKISKNFTIKNNQRSGENKTYYSNGQVWVSSSYLFGDLHGKYIEYYEDGTIAEQGEYAYGEKVGTYKWFNRKGKLTDLRSYDNGNLHGTAQFFSDSGKLTMNVLFYQGNSIKITKK